MRKNIYTLRTLIFLALLAALGAVFSAFLSIELNFIGTKTVEASLTPVPVILAGILFGPLAGALVGFVADTAGFFMGLQMGAYNPAFSVTMALYGVIAGLFYLRAQKSSVWRVAAIVPTAQVICSVVLNTLLIWLFYSVPLKVLLSTRLITAAIEVPIYIAILIPLTAALWPLVKNQKSRQTT